MDRWCLGVHWDAYVGVTMKAEYKCEKCGHEWEEEPGFVVCAKCMHEYVEWKNYDEFVKRRAVNAEAKTC